VTNSAFKKILVPLDGSRLAQQVLPYASGFASTLGAGLVLFTVLEEAGDSQVAEARLEDLAAELRESGLGVATDSRTGTPSNEIVAAATRYEADLILMTGHGSPAGRKDLLGSTAHNVMRSCHTPVLLVPLTTRGFVRPSAIVFGHDGSENASPALKPAVELASALECELVIVRAVEPVSGLSGAAKYYSAVDDFAEEEMKKLARELAKTGCKVTTHVGKRPPEQELLAVAGSRPGSIITVSTRSLSSEVGVLGSTTDRLVRSQERPVLAVPAD